ncbi:MAG: ABC transporter ATP-binding protein [Flavobacteriales bacterium]|nr:ABC transporter ATP-binding protein [Flavobacteriales bacterium]NNK80216.1 ABC transporter ATP-binding protein [Flavobacteriales bacterium]
MKELTIKDLTFGYAGRPLGYISQVTFRSGELNYLFGPNGIGKSTLFKTIAGQVPALSFGSMTLDQKELSKTSTKNRSNLISFLQSSRVNSRISVMDFFEIGLTTSNLRRSSRSLIRERIVEKCSTYGLTHLLDKYIWSTSDGEYQKILILLSVLRECPVLLMDEPLTHLDPPNQREVMNLFKKLSVDHILVLSTHNIEKLKDFSGRSFAICHDSSFQELENQLILKNSGLVKVFGEKMKNFAH